MPSLGVFSALTKLIIGMLASLGTAASYRFPQIEALDRSDLGWPVDQRP